MKNFGEREMVGRSRNSVQVVERRRECANSSVNRRMEWRQINLPKQLLGHFSSVVVASPLDSAVSDVMLGATDHAFRVRHITALKASHSGRSDHRAEIGIFAGAFHNASPARIT